jgi:hypothetical protein
MLQVPIVLHPVPRPALRALPVVLLQVSAARTRQMDAEREHAAKMAAVPMTHVPLPS